MEYTVFDRKKVYKKMRLKRSKFQEILKKITRLNFQTFCVFVGQKSIFRRYFIQHVKDGSQIQVYNINSESVTHFSLFYFKKSSEKFKKISG